MPSNNFSHFINPKKSEIIIPTILKSLQMYSFENEELSQVCGKYVYVVKDSISLGCVVIDKSQDIQIVPLLGPKLDQWLCLYPPPPPPIYMSSPTEQPTKNWVMEAC